MPVLSVCVPTYNRPAMLEHALRSVLATSPETARGVEIVVSDNSPDDRTATVAEELLAGWAGPVTYRQHRPNVGMVGNFNSCVELATGQWVDILHDDDYVLPGAVSRMVAGIRRAGTHERALLFGVRVVAANGRLLRPQVHPRERPLSPQQALSRVLSRSSFVRFPAAVVRRDAYQEAGPFDESVGGFADVDMWRRLFGTWGLRVMPSVTAAYVVHPEAETERVFTAEGVETIMTIFDRAARQGVLSEPVVRAHQRHWLHQFILAGAFRRLRARDRTAAQAVLGLFDLPSVRELGISKRWLPVRAAISAAAYWGPSWSPAPVDPQSRGGPSGRPHDQ